MSFADNTIATGGYAPAWTEVRFVVRPLIPFGPFTGDLRLRGVREYSGGGYAQEGVTLVFDASGSGKPTKITKGRQNPNEVTLKLDPDTYKNIYAPIVAKGQFDFVMVIVGPGGLIPSSTETYNGCTDTGMDPQFPNDGNPVERTVKFKPTSYDPPKAAPIL